MHTVNSYSINVPGKNILNLPLGSRVLQPYLDPFACPVIFIGEPQSTTKDGEHTTMTLTEFKIHAVETGHPVPENCVHIGSILMRSKFYHIFEEI